MRTDHPGQPEPFTGENALEVPDRDRAPGAGPDLHPKAVGARVAALPLADPPRAADLLLEVIGALNRTPIDAGGRAAAVALLRPPLRTVMDALAGSYTRSPLPLSETERRRAGLVLELAKEGAYAEKLLVLHPVAAGAGEPAFPRALARSAAALARLLLEHYRLYAVEPRGVWGELHRLYRHAEALWTAVGRNGPAAGALGELFREYRRAALLALADPYHLVPGEVAEVHRGLGGWVEAQPLRPPVPGGGVGGRFYVVLDGATAPAFGVPGCAAPAGGVRVVPVAGVLHEVAARIAALGGRGAAGAAGRSSLAQRLERAMWLRLHRTWSARAARGSARLPAPAPVRIAIGIGSCHHFLSRGADFHPERDEVEIRNGPLPEASTQLSLVPKELEPWKRHEEVERLRNGIARPRETRFDPEDRERDVWDKVYAHPVDEIPTAPGFVALRWERFDSSPGGLAVRGRPPRAARVRVGQLAAYLDLEAQPARADASAWTLGIVRWLRIHDDGHMELGIERIADRAQPVATRGVAGTGGGTEYFRALGVPGADGDGAIAGIVVPAAVYDVGSVLAVNLTTRLLYVRLTRMRESTGSFARFDYRVVPAPLAEREFLPEIPPRGP